MERWSVNCPRCKKPRYYAAKSCIWVAKKKRSLCRKCHWEITPSKSMATNMKALLDETPEAYYWAGFIAADGSIERRGGLKFGLIDHDHVRMLAKFIGWRGRLHEYKKANFLSFRVVDVRLVRQFSDKFELRPGKTYDPPTKIPSRRRDLRLAYAVGLVDGDGYISKQSMGRPDAFLTIKCHRSWLRFLEYIFKILSRSVLRGDVVTGYARCTLANHTVLKRLKAEVLKLELPILKRKWDAIDMKYVSRTETAVKHRKVIVRLLKKDYAKVDIARHLGISPSTISQMISRKTISAYIGRKKGR